MSTPTGPTRSDVDSSSTQTGRPTMPPVEKNISKRLFWFVVIALAGIVLFRVATLLFTGE